MAKTDRSLATMKSQADAICHPPPMQAPSTTATTGFDIEAIAWSARLR